MKRSSINFIVDFLAFAGFVFLTTTGILIYYILPAGTGRFAEIWGLDRHEWGVIHYWFAIATLALLAVHLFLHYKWFVGLIKGRRPREGSGGRLLAGIVGLLSLIALSTAPFFAEIERIEKQPSRMSDGGYVINGSTTIQEIETATGVPASVILSELKLPPNTPKTEQFGRLEKQYNISIQDVRDAIDKHAKKTKDK